MATHVYEEGWVRSRNLFMAPKRGQKLVSNNVIARPMRILRSVQTHYSNARWRICPSFARSFRGRYFNWSTEYCRIFKILVVLFIGCFCGFLFPFWYTKENRTNRVTRNQLGTPTAVFERPDALCPPVAWADVMQQVLVAHSCSELCVVKCLRHDERRCKANDCKHPSAHKVHHDQNVKLWKS